MKIILWISFFLTLNKLKERKKYNPFDFKYDYNELYKIKLLINNIKKYTDYLKNMKYSKSEENNNLENIKYFKILNNIYDDLMEEKEDIKDSIKNCQNYVESMPNKKLIFMFRFYNLNKWYEDEKYKINDKLNIEDFSITDNKINHLIIRIQPFILNLKLNLKDLEINWEKFMNSFEFLKTNYKNKTNVDKNLDDLSIDIENFIDIKISLASIFPKILSQAEKLRNLRYDFLLIISKMKYDYTKPQLKHMEFNNKFKKIAFLQKFFFNLILIIYFN